MTQARVQQPTSRVATVVWLMSAVAVIVAAAFSPRIWSLLALLVATACVGVALGQVLGLRHATNWRADLAACVAWIALLGVYTALAAILIGYPLQWLRNAATLGTVLTTSAAVVLALLTLWRVWPAFGFTLIDEVPSASDVSRRAVLGASLDHAWQLTARHELFFPQGLGVSVALLGLAQAMLSLSGMDAPIAAAYRLPAMAVYALAIPAAIAWVLRTSARCMLLDRRRPQVEPVSALEPAARAADTISESAPPADSEPVADVNTMLLRCVRAGQAQLALDALAHGADPNTVPSPDDRDQRSALVLAALHPDMRLLRGFIARGADLQRTHAGLPVLIAATRDSNEGRAEAVMTLITNGAHVHCTDAAGNSPLHFAALAQTPIVAALLCDAGATIDAINGAGQTPLGVACEAANWPLVKFLLERGAKPELPHAQPVIIAAASTAEDDAQGVQILLKRRARVDARDALERTALMAAALQGHAEIAETLLRANANVDAVDVNGTSALIEAARAGAIEVIDALAAHKPNPDRTDNAGRTALIVACQSTRADEAVVRRLLTLGVSRQIAANDGRRAVDCAASAGRWTIVAMLDPDYVRPASVIDASAAQSSSRVPLEHLLDALRFGHWAIAEKFAQAFADTAPADQAAIFKELASETDFAARTWLLNHGLDANSKLANGVSLMQAAIQQLPEGLPIVLQLLDAGAQASGCAGLQGVFAAIPESGAAAREMEALALRLVDAGADTFAPDAESRTPLMHAVSGGCVRLVEVLLERGVDPHVRDRMGRTALFCTLAAPRVAAADVIKLLLRAGADPDMRAANNETVLGLALAGSHAGVSAWLNWPHWKLPRRALRDADLVSAAACGDRAAVEKLLDLGLALEAQDEFGATALLHAAGEGHAQLVDFLLARGADPRHAANTGATALSAAINGAHRDVLQRLLDRGIDPNVRLHAGTTCLMLAAARGQVDFVNLLLDRGAQAGLADEHGATALHAAARFAFANDDAARACAICTALLAAGANVDARNCDGQTPLLILLGAHVPPRTRAEQRTLLEAFEVLRARGAGIDAQDDRGVGPLHACAMHGMLLPARALLAAGADTSRCDLLGRTPREVAHVLGFIDVAAELEAAHSRRLAV